MITILCQRIWQILTILTNYYANDYTYYQLYFDHPNECRPFTRSWCCLVFTQDLFLWNYVHPANPILFCRVRTRRPWKRCGFPGGQGGYEHWKGLPHRFGRWESFPIWSDQFVIFDSNMDFSCFYGKNLQLDHHVPLEAPKKIALTTLLDVRYIYDWFKTKYSVQDGPVLVINGVATFCRVGTVSPPLSQHNMKHFRGLNDITNSLFKTRPWEKESSSDE